jgi:hypothetical protein
LSIYHDEVVPRDIVAHAGDDSTDLRLYTSTKLKIVNHCLYSFKHKKQNLYLNNI